MMAILCVCVWGGGDEERGVISYSIFVVMF